jgi:hypothetical protein
MKKKLQDKFCVIRSYYCSWITGMKAVSPFKSGMKLERIDLLNNSFLSNILFCLYRII